MKKKIIAVIALTLALLVALSACGSKTTDVKMGTGGTTGTYYAFGGIIAGVYSDKIEGLNVSVMSTGASRANVFEIVDGNIDMAIAQNDVIDYAYNGTDLFQEDGKISGFSAMAGLYAEVCQIVARPGIESIADLAGKRVSVGDAGSGTEFNARQIMESYGLSFNDIDKQNLSFGDSADALKDGKIDAFFCVAGAPTTAIVELATSNDIVILEIDQEHSDALIAIYPFYTRYSVPGGSYNGISDDVWTVAVKATVIVSDTLAEDVVYNMTKALFDYKSEITDGHAKGAELDPNYAVDGISIPFHPGAVKYFKEIGLM